MSLASGRIYVEKSQGTPYLEQNFFNFMIFLGNSGKI